MTEERRKEIEREKEREREREREREKDRERERESGRGRGERGEGRGRGRGREIDSRRYQPPERTTSEPKLTVTHVDGIREMAGGTSRYLRCTS